MGTKNRPADNISDALKTKRGSKTPPKVKWEGNKQ